MCTLIVATRVWPNRPLVVAANRDEALGRPAGPPAIDDSGPLSVLAPVDLEKKGTWLGLNEKGLFVGITNRFMQPKNDSFTSRGSIVRQALEEPTAQDAFERMRKLDPEWNNGFHLVMADREGAYLVWCGGGQLTTSVLPPDVYIITERSFAAGDTEREPLLSSLLAEKKSPEVDDLKRILAHHNEQNSFDGICVHVPSWNYGTRSSSIISLSETVAFLHAPGPPCETKYDDYSHLAHKLLNKTS